MSTTSDIQALYSNIMKYNDLYRSHFHDSDAANPMRIYPALGHELFCLEYFLEMERSLYYSIISLFVSDLLDSGMSNNTVESSIPLVIQASDLTYSLSSQGAPSEGNPLYHLTKTLYSLFGLKFDAVKGIELTSLIKYFMKSSVTLLKK